MEEVADTISKFFSKAGKNPPVLLCILTKKFSIIT